MIPAIYDHDHHSWSPVSTLDISAYVVSLRIHSETLCEPLFQLIEVLVQLLDDLFRDFDSTNLAFLRWTSHSFDNSSDTRLTASYGVYNRFQPSTLLDNFVSLFSTCISPYTTSISIRSLGLTVRPRMTEDSQYFSLEEDDEPVPIPDM
jgi:hypothetical protein